MEKNEIMKNWAANTKMDIGVLNGIYDTQQAIVKGKKPNLTDKELEQKTLEAVGQELKKRFKNRGENLEVLLTHLFVKDDAVRGKSDADAAWKQSPELAQKKGYANENGDFLYTKGYKKGRVIPGHDFTYTLVGINRKGEKVKIDYNKEIEDETIKAFDQVPSNVKTCAWYNFSVSKNQKPIPDYNCYYYKGDLFFDKIADATEADMKMVRTAFKDVITPIAKLQDFAIASKGNYNAFAVVDGFLMSIKLSPKPDKNPSMEIDNGDITNILGADGNVQGSITAYAASQMMIDVQTGLEENTPITAFVRVYMSKDGAAKVSLGGYYVDKKYTAPQVPAIDIEPSSTEEDDALEIENVAVPKEVKKEQPKKEEQKKEEPKKDDDDLF